jgi:hypothetical protein
MKNKKYKGIFLCLFLAVIFSGCTTPGMKGGPMHFGKPAEFTMRPEKSLGATVTPDLENGNVTVIANPMSDGQFGGEAYPGRIAFPGVVTTDKGEVAFAQSILVGNYPSGEFMSFVIIDGKISDLKSAKFLPLSSFTQFAWDKFDNLFPIEKDKFYDGTAYIIETANKYGILIGERKLVKGFDQIVRSWNRYSTEHGDIYSPLSQADIQEVAKINPGYSPVEKLILRNEAVISLNPYEMIAKASITIFKAMTGKTVGWDIGSMVRREQMAWTVEFIGSFRKEMLRQLLTETAKKDAEIASLKKSEEQKMAVKKVNRVDEQTIQPKKVIKKRRGL